MRRVHAADEVGMHYIGADLSMAEPWEELAAEDIIDGFEALLMRHARFQDFLKETGQDGVV